LTPLAQARQLGRMQGLCTNAREPLRAGHKRINFLKKRFGTGASDFLFFTQGV
jgi:hypothetical protein